MPLTINVGLSRKASEDYQSAGVSINVTAELDQSLLERPGELQDRIGDLYALAHESIDRQSAAMQPRLRRKRHQRIESQNGNGNGGNGSGHQPMTDSQRQLILLLANEHHVDPYESARDHFGIEFQQMTRRQASVAIDDLKAALR
ncbi:MAG TPA: hypothetical protein VK797_23110 [Tepidisphaeraceae bacterium]|jgi:hypothetical protein|nr:hypothetical protein [Tepidisphaeraceae bacterium]